MKEQRMDLQNGELLTAGLKVPVSVKRQWEGVSLQLRQ